VANVPFFVPQDGPWKLRQEDFKSDIRQAAGHIRLLRESLQGATPHDG
jgi:hypothetical protein